MSWHGVITWIGRKNMDQVSTLERVFNYKAKANVRKRWGHRQKYTAVEITKISAK